MSVSGHGIGAYMRQGFNGTPAYKRIQSTILQRIETGQLRPGDAVNSERELAKIHRVSLMTARHALATLERGSLFSTLEHNYGLEIAHADEEVDATAADLRTAQLLGITRQDPLLRIRQVIYSTKGKPTIYVLGLYRSDRHTLLIRRFR